ncbi:hypothetical protein D3C73_1246060 [compost metagenome]
MIEALGVLLFMRISMFERIQHGLILVVRLRQCSECGAVIAVIEELVNLHAMEPFFFGLHQEKVGESVEALAGTVGGHRQIDMGGVEFEIHLFIECLHQFILHKHVTSSL